MCAEVQDEVRLVSIACREHIENIVPNWGPISRFRPDTPTPPEIIRFCRATTVLRPIAYAVVFATIARLLPRQTGGNGPPVSAAREPICKESVEAGPQANSAVRLDLIDISVSGEYEKACSIDPRDCLLYRCLMEVQRIRPGFCQNDLDIGGRLLLGLEHPLLPLSLH